MVTAFQNILSPEAAWFRIAEARHGVLRVFFFVALPLLAMGIAADAAGLYFLGDEVPGQDAMKNYQGEVHRLAAYAGISLGLGLLILFLGARLIRWIAVEFNQQPPFAWCFCVAAYGLSPVFILRAFDAIPGAPTWVCWGIGATLTFRTLYHGVGPGLEPDQTKTMGLWIMSGLILIPLSGIAHFVTVMYLRGTPF